MQPKITYSNSNTPQYNTYIPLYAGHIPTQPIRLPIRPMAKPLMHQENTASGIVTLTAPQILHQGSILGPIISPQPLIIRAKGRFFRIAPMQDRPHFINGLPEFNHNLKIYITQQLTKINFIRLLQPTTLGTTILCKKKESSNGVIGHIMKKFILPENKLENMTTKLKHPSSRRKDAGQVAGLFLGFLDSLLLSLDCYLV